MDKWVRRSTRKLESPELLELQPVCDPAKPEPLAPGPESKATAVGRPPARAKGGNEASVSAPADAARGPLPRSDQKLKGAGARDEVTKLVDVKKETRPKRKKGEDDSADTPEKLPKAKQAKHDSDDEARPRRSTRRKDSKPDEDDEVEDGPHTYPTRQTARLARADKGKR